MWSRLFNFFSRVRDKGGGKMAKSKKSDIKKDLLDQLELQSKYGKFYVDLVDDYIYLYDLKEKLKKDLTKKGIRYNTTNGNGISVEKNNDSLLNLTKINTQMLKILNDLNIKEPSDHSTGDDNDLL